MIQPLQHISNLWNAYGDIFDCVDIYKQSSLDHPLLKDHTVQMAPSSFPRGSIEEITSRTLFSQIKFLSEDCPIGTIPITRPRKRKYSLPGTSSSTSIDAQDNIIQPLISYEAELRMKSGNYYGAEADLNVYGPQVSVNQLSSNAIWILNDGNGTGSREQVNGIVAGWMDTRTGDWWMAYGEDQQAVGYWPKSLFSTLNDHATKVYWGGLVQSPADETSPPMGSGHFPDEGLRRACYSAGLSLINGSNYYKRIPEGGIEFYNNDPGCYNVGYLMNMEAGTQGFLFGGPGNCAWMI